ncbi:hypothetical protein CXK91_19125 [Stutzerimonas stutzeri]|uniref:VCBS repeat-containing protein n=1 Tax=Stutzerimonas stutzeri TaxID=316 RepID=A0A2S4AJZ0_STUST|nr:hypothetical protein [Stutzerimonas stutzeri]MCQ4264702.1 hypothetical protein [Stutzerimonas stutzeri]POH81542.1 hypothetical protein CXK91_19125 [Stutzerimonas stutzeri]
MKLSIVILILASFNAAAGEAEVCKGNKGARSFLSEWWEGGRISNILTTIQGAEILRERGRIAYQADLNGDGNQDYIFESFDSQGSAKDRTFGIFIQCRGFLQFLGGDYFAGVEEIGSKNNGYNDVIFLSYQRDKSDEVINAEGQALTRSHVWSFNPGSGKYEGGMD